MNNIPLSPLFPLSIKADILEGKGEKMFRLPMIDKGDIPIIGLVFLAIAIYLIGRWLK